MGKEMDGLFSERTPEAAATQLALVLAHATECQLATVESLELRKRTSLSELRRHRIIAAELVFNCADLNVPPRGFWGGACPRLAELLKVPKTELHARLQSAKSGAA